MYRFTAGGVIVIALIAAVVFGVAAASKGRGLVAGLAAFLVAAAPFALGVLVGFLFGIPKTLQIEGPTNGNHRTQTNTNLEQISDWLTKILIGVGLTQLGEIPETVQRTADYVATAINLDVSSGASAIVALILVYFAVAGFMVGYLVTRLVLEPAFDRPEPDPEAVQRLVNARPPDIDGKPVDKRDAAEVLRFSVADLRTPDQMIAWGRAKLEQNPERAIDVLERAVEQAPVNRRAVETLMFAALYLPPPAGFTRAAEVGRAYLDRPGRKDEPDDADIYAYLACALGQQHRWEREHGGTADTLKLARDLAVAAAKRAVELAPKWKMGLRNVMIALEGQTENDLASLKDDQELQALLAVDPPKV